MKKRTVSIKCKDADCGEGFEITEIVESKKDPIDLSNVRCPSHKSGGGYDLKVVGTEVEDFDPVGTYFQSEGVELPATAVTIKKDPASEQVEKDLQRQSEQERKDQEDRQRQEEETRLRDQIRTRFFASNPNAADADFERLYPSLRDAEMVNRFRERPVGEGDRYLNSAYSVKRESS